MVTNAQGPVHRRRRHNQLARALIGTRCHRTRQMVRGAAASLDGDTAADATGFG